MYLLDTTILIGILRGNKDFLKKYSKICARNQTSYLTFYSIAEIYIGFFELILRNKASSRLKIQQDLFERIILQLKTQERILSLEIDAAKKMGELISRLKFNGTPIPLIDALICAISLSKDLTVITSDKRHFKTVKEVISEFQVEFW
jgi:predicted nucleic acid-binding protein